MAKSLRVGQRELGKTVLERMAREKKLPPSLVAAVRGFAAQQRGFEAASKKAEAARAERDAALDVVGAADAALDTQVDVLANKLIGAGLGPRKNPFAPFGAPPPHKLKVLAYTTEVEEVVKLIAAIKKKKPDKAVTAALATTAQLADKSKKALIALVTPQTQYVQALSARDALLVEWTRAFERLRVIAKAAWVDAPSTYAAVFAPPGLEAARPARRKAKPVAPTPAPTPPSPPVVTTPPPPTASA
jgi:hypothetical protein